MHINYQYRPFTIWKSFLITFILQIIPYPIQLFYLPKPSWIILLLFYWVIKSPNHFNIGSAFIIGLITDILSGPILGIRAIILSIITYILITKLPMFYNFSRWKQSSIIILFSFNIHLITHITYIISNENIKFNSDFFLKNIFLNSLTDGIIWIVIFLIMSKTHTNDIICKKS